MARVSPPLLFAYCLLWCVPIAIGIWMYARDTGQTWERTEKGDNNHDLVRAGGHARGQRDRSRP